MTDNISEWRATSDGSGAKRPATGIELHQTGGGQMNRGTLYRIECPDCGATGENVAWHGHNCYYECPSCGTTVKLIG
jgi:ribosomal protein S27E